jgi:hypothetical protein
VGWPGRVELADRDLERKQLGLTGVTSPDSPPRREVLAGRPHGR